MSEKLYKVEVDCSTGLETRTELTPEEVTEHEIMQQESQDKAAIIEAAAQDKADAKASGIEKLSALGLSDAEIAAITGA